jgi:NADH:ubiquinone oxidoreductase subunit 5 (subunit L)/multisubunit Na+/H+ antiporter MnhA subunit
LLFVAEGAGLGIFYSADLVMLYFWLEAVGLALYFLSGPGLRGASAKVASYRALGVNFLAGLLIFAPLLVIISRNGGRSTYADLIPAALDTTLFALIIAGCLIKAAQFPFQAWLGGFEDLPGAAYGLLTAGIVFPFALYLPSRLQSIVGDRLELLTSAAWLLLPVGAFTIFFAAALALRQQVLPAKVGLLTAAQFGFVILALGLDDLPGAYQQLISLAIGAPLLFLCADQLQIENAPPPNPENRVNPKPLGRPALFRGLLAGTYAIGALNFAGLPLSPAYAARWQTLSNLLSGDNRFYFGLALIGLVLMLPALVQGLLLFMNGPRQTVEARGQEWYWTLAGPLILAGLSIVLGFNPSLADGWLSNAIGRVRPGGANTLASETLAPGAWVGLLAVAGLLAGFLLYYWWGRRWQAATAYNGGLAYGLPKDDKPKFARTGRSKMALKVIEPEEEVPEGFEDEFFASSFKKTSVQPQVPRRPLPDPRLSPADYFGPLNSRLKEAYKILDTGYIGRFFSTLLLRLLDRIRRVFEWTVERFYPALAAFILIVFIILLTR